VRYQLNPSVVGRQALAELEEAQRVDAKCGLAAYYAGLIHTALGSAEQAERQLRRALKLMAPDRRPIEALKELQKKHKR
jgi:tetratricopeptide (TPR) repeat protein